MQYSKHMTKFGKIELSVSPFVQWLWTWVRRQQWERFFV